MIVTFSYHCYCQKKDTVYIRYLIISNAIINDAYNKEKRCILNNIINTIASHYINHWTKCNFFLSNIIMKNIGETTSNTYITVLILLAAIIVNTISFVLALVVVFVEEFPIPRLHSILYNALFSPVSIVDSCFIYSKINFNYCRQWDIKYNQMPLSFIAVNVSHCQYVCTFPNTRNRVLSIMKNIAPMCNDCLMFFQFQSCVFNFVAMIL